MGPIGSKIISHWADIYMQTRWVRPMCTLESNLGFKNSSAVAYKQNCLTFSICPQFLLPTHLIVLSWQFQRKVHIALSTEPIFRPSCLCYLCMYNLINSILQWIFGIKQSQKVQKYLFSEFLPAAPASDNGLWGVSGSKLFHLSSLENMAFFAKSLFQTRLFINTSPLSNKGY